jgi:hypothetical protein
VKIFTVLIAALITGIAASVLFFYSYQSRPGHDIVERIDNDDMFSVVFGNATNLTNNKNDSVYGQVAAWNNSVYVVWQDSISGRNYDIFVKKSSDEGQTYGDEVNLSNNPGFSEHPQLSALGSNVYVAWADNTAGNREVLFARSNDGGASFENSLNLSNDTSDSHNQEIAAFANNVYVVWIDRDEEENRSILFRVSSDGGETFGAMVSISDKASNESFPKVAAHGNDVYITWNVMEENANGGLYFAKSSDMGSTFESITKLDENSGESQVAAYNGTVYIVSGGLDSAEANGLIFLKSSDGGETFAEPLRIDATNKFANPLNVEVVASDTNIAYVVGQVSVVGNEEILLLPIEGDDTIGIVNLSMNEKISECPSIAIAMDNIYVVWEDLTPGNHEVLYSKGIKT